MMSPRSVTAAQHRVPWTIGLALIWVGLRWASGFDGLYGQDAHEYLRYSVALKTWLGAGIDPGFSRWPPGYPMAAALLSFLGPSVLLSTQLVSGIAWLLAFWFGAETLSRLYSSRRVSAYWALFFCLSPFLMRVALSSMSDMVAIALGCAFVSRSVAWLETGRPAQLGTAFLCLGLAGATRFSAPLVLGPLAGWLLLSALRRRDGRAFGAALLGGGIPLVWAHRMSSVQTLALSNAEEWDWRHALARSFSTESAGTQSYLFPNIVASFTPLVDPGFCFLGIVLLVLVRRGDFSPGPIRVMALSWMVFALFLSGLALQNDRHHLASFPLAISCLFPAYDRFMNSVGAAGTSRERRWASTAAMMAAQLGLLALASRTLLAGQRQELLIAERLRGEPSVTLFAFGFTQALRNRGVPQSVVELWDTEPTFARTGDLVLFAPQRLATQWRNRPLMKNFDMLKPRLSSASLGDVGGGWFLYRVAAPDSESIQ